LFGLASEGALGPNPGIGLIPWNVEFVILFDDARGRKRLPIGGRSCPRPGIERVPDPSLSGQRREPQTQK
jgi:hypothetical protein